MEELELSLLMSTGSGDTSGNTVVGSDLALPIQRNTNSNNLNISYGSGPSGT
jgi:hypothetical protein